MSADSPFHWINLTPEEGHFTFGYYDRCPWNETNEFHLSLKIPQQERLPEPGETAEVGYIDRKQRTFHSLATTEAWCHQQGAMTLWLQHKPECLIYNDYKETQSGTWQPVCRICHINDGIVGEYDRHIYTMSNDGKLGASLDISRIPRRGYSYARGPMDWNVMTPDLDKEGLFIVDMETGKSKLIASYRQMMDIHPVKYDLEGKYIWLNHSIFNSDASRVMVLLRYTNLDNSFWKTYMYTMNVDGSDLMCSLSDIFWEGGKITHQIWGRTPREILVDAKWGSDDKHNYVVFQEDVQPIQAERISSGMGPGGHLVFSPDGKWMAADTYPDGEGMQHLALVETDTGNFTKIGTFKHFLGCQTGDIRCDLHPRWSKDGKLLTIDTTHEGPRKIYLLERE